MAFIENFIGYTEVDPNSRITRTTRRVTWTDLTMNEDAYVYKDKGVDFFDGNFIHYLTVHLSAYANTVRGHFWALTNTLDDLWGIDVGGGSYLALRLEWNDPNLTFRLQECYSGTTAESGNISISEDTTYYVKIVRDESVGTYGTLYLYIYSDPARTTQVGSTVSVALHTSKKDFRYIHAIISFDNNLTTYTMSGYTSNLQLTATQLEVTTQPVTAITATTATGNGIIVDLGIATVTQHGVCWDSTIDPTTTDSSSGFWGKTSEGAGSLGAFTSSITGLSEGQQYYVRAYATSTEGTVYGANVVFTATSVTTSTPLIQGNLAIVQQRLQYIDADGVERYILGTPT